MRQPQLLRPGVLLKRVRQLAYLGSHPFSHGRCETVIRESGLANDPLVPLKYLGDHIALSLQPRQRRQALMGHYEALPSLLGPAAQLDLHDGIEIWRRDCPGDSPPLSIVLEQSRLAPMEGELQLRFAFRSDLYVLTFLIAPGDAFGIEAGRILFIGGIQGRVGSREEMREASKLNGEISPAAMLIIAIQTVARITQVDELVAIGENDQISIGYSRTKIMFDYARFWTEAGGLSCGSYFRLPLEAPQKPLHEIPRGHRRRTKLKRQAKELVRESLETCLVKLIDPRLVTRRGQPKPAIAITE